MLISFNLKSKTTFTGTLENIGLSREIVKNFRSKVGRPHSDSHVLTKILQHEGNPKFEDISKRLMVVQEKYTNELTKLRHFLYKWRMRCVDSEPPISMYKESLIKFIKKHKAANCQEMAEIIQCEHIEKGIRTHNITFLILNKNTDAIVNSHVFSLSNLPKSAKLTKPATWGEAVLIDAWTGSGFVDQAIQAKGLVKKGALNEVLKYFNFNPEKEKIIFMENDSELAKYYLKHMKKRKVDLKSVSV